LIYRVFLPDLSRRGSTTPESGTILFIFSADAIRSAASCASFFWFAARV